MRRALQKCNFFSCQYSKNLLSFWIEYISTIFCHTSITFRTHFEIFEVNTFICWKFSKTTYTFHSFRKIDWVVIRATVFSGKKGGHFLLQFALPEKYHFREKRLRAKKHRRSKIYECFCRWPFDNVASRHKPLPAGSPEARAEIVCRRRRNWLRGCGDVWPK
jgi:hypothetical protein